ncbi:MAG: Fis family transcriptional regulator [delta proteobacterium MLS_D]|jgi:DNA-binding NtrC family response regulator|nr:MAG: Fis family transcriptional regulator [delta proteobacterium MLS_D]
MRPILIVDDEPSMRAALSESLQSCGYDVETAGDGEDALRRFRRDSYEVVVTDMRMPRIGGMEVLSGIKKISPETPVIVITAYGTVNTAVEAMRAGAVDFIMKPFSLEHLESVVERVVGDNGGLPKQQDRDEGRRNSFVTADKKMMAILDMMNTVAAARSSVFIHGESGTGKELLARHIHLRGNRAQGPFVAVNCAAIPGNLLESEMFGYEKGAFTGAARRKPGKFELAHGGSLLLDEISEMDLQLQAKMLRVIQESEIDPLGGSGPVSVDVRIIATTNTDIRRAVEEGKFRRDLFYRLNVIPVTIPPLRERKTDIALLADLFLERYSSLNGIGRPSLSDEARRVLENHVWPGNVRELENVIERSVLLCTGKKILPEHLYLERAVGRDDEPTGDSVSDNGFETTGGTIREMERNLIFRTLERVQGNKARASRILGISVRTMRNKLHEYGVEN